MKYLSLIIFVALLSWTWHLVHHESPVSFETHSGIQDRMAELINTTVKAKRPSATDITVEKIWTEVIGSGKVKAFFVYSFKDSTGDSSPVSSQITGEGLLERQKPDESGKDRWILTKVQTTGDSVQFDEATLITGSATGTATSEAPTAETPAAASEETSETHK